LAGQAAPLLHPQELSFPGSSVVRTPSNINRRSCTPHKLVRMIVYRGTSLKRNTHPPRINIGFLHPALPIQFLWIGSVFGIYMDWVGLPGLDWCHIFSGLDWFSGFIWIGLVYVDWIGSRVIGGQGRAALLLHPELPFPPTELLMKPTHQLRWRRGSDLINHWEMNGRCYANINARSYTPAPP